MAVNNCSEVGRIAAVVVLYNPDAQVLENLQTYKSQVDELIVFDNSVFPNDDILSPLRNSSNTQVVSPGRNTGIAHALNYSAVVALSLGCTHLLTMDQDSTVPNGMVKELILAQRSLPHCALISPVHCNKFGTGFPSNGEIVSVKAVKASGNLIHLKTHQQCGGFNEDYFIDYVDIEYCWRLYQNGYSVYQHNAVLMPHAEADFSKARFLFWTVYPYNNAPVRWFYKTRNLFYLTRQYFSSRRKDVLHEINYYNKNVLKMILFEKNRYLKLKMIFRGLSAYIRQDKGIFHEQS